MRRDWTVRPATLEDAKAWGALRCALWPGEDDDWDREDVRSALDRDGRATAFLAVDAAGTAIGFSEATLRCDYVNGTESSPVGCLAGWWVAPAWGGRAARTAATASSGDTAGTTCRAPNRGARVTRSPRSPAQRLDRGDQVDDRFLRVAEEHHGRRVDEERVVDPREAVCHRTFQDNRRLGLVDVPDRHPLDRDAGVVAGVRVDVVVRADHE